MSEEVETDLERVTRWYDSHAERQWGWTDRNRVEFGVTLRTLQEYLPPAPADVLDVGGGSGRYAINLAERGYTVTLFDLSAGCLAPAREKAQAAGITLAGYVQGSATDLGVFPNERFPTVVAMGPFYHLLSRDERHQALEELRRVLHPIGVLFATFVSRFTPLRFSAHQGDPAFPLLQRPTTEALLRTGVMLLRDTPLETAAWVDAYCAHPAEIRPFLEEQGFETIALVGCEGIYSFIQDRTNVVPDDLWPELIELNYRLGKEPSLHGAAEHLLYVGRKRAIRPCRRHRAGGSSR